MKIPEKMKAAVLYGFNDVRVVERKVPLPGRDEALVKIAACGVCGGDIKIIKRGMPKQPPFEEFIIGHEYSGTIAAVGEGIDEFKPGDRVVVEVHKGCGRCKNCIMGKYTACLNYGNFEKGHRANGFTTNGGFAEYAVNHVNTLCKLPDNISFEEATLATTAGTSLYGIDMAGGYISGEAVAILGPGSIGLMAVQCCKALGAGRVILNGTRDDRLELGKKLGADNVVNVNRENPVEIVRELTSGIGADLVLVAAGMEESLQQALEMTRRGGEIVLLAHFDDPVTIDIGLAVKNGINIFTVRGEGRMSVHRAISLMAEGKIEGKSLITHTFPLENINEALTTFMERKDNALKVVVHP
ncbi:MAG: alcohol dehydrogenase catalytic domain-containing protein [Deltaproteobacteria bacterium]|nr:alcohol dehydrogenase catalytic domain-containing protein [Deltaproteobacteria bacterium]MBW1919891.1 alcohol dehydrogenase catalytic domain-containing protein [Deltaproteobacteria bacterium]MBW1934223.1 alcohol dehydrogenase catalytic domain-containing protein [Deltaproteobacteria bacterium]MBW1976478.1 alcohol dehydrogenase catalytic domain-containing protein [Deltaproteobacteria bacterium]MBW2044237.1 alcohol dehydrogenase catalytic domain-containing protein [Deltaproteobacteria bacterium